MVPLTRDSVTPQASARLESVEYMSPLPENLRHKLPPQSDDGYYHVDALLDGRWKGVLVLDSEARIVGWRECREITCDPGDFDDHPIEDATSVSPAKIVRGNLPTKGLTGRSDRQDISASILDLGAMNGGSMESGDSDADR